MRLQKTVPWCALQKVLITFVQSCAKLAMTLCLAFLCCITVHQESGSSFRCCLFIGLYRGQTVLVSSLNNLFFFLLSTSDIFLSLINYS